MTALSSTAQMPGTTYTDWVAFGQATNRSEPASGSSSSREAELVQQLDARLSGQLARIRSQIQPASDAGNATTGGVGQLLDIRA